VLNDGGTRARSGEARRDDPVRRLAAALADRYVIERELGAGGMEATTPGALALEGPLRVAEGRTGRQWHVGIAFTS
jgi:hypothetical protein